MSNHLAGCWRLAPAARSGTGSLMATEDFRSARLAQMEIDSRFRSVRAEFSRAPSGLRAYAQLARDWRRGWASRFH